MGFNNKDLKKINALIAKKDTMPVDVYIAKLRALKFEIINDIVVDTEIEHGGKEVLIKANQILKTN